MPSGYEIVVPLLKFLTGIHVVEGIAITFLALIAIGIIAGTIALILNLATRRERQVSNRLAVLYENTIREMDERHEAREKDYVEYQERMERRLQTMQRQLSSVLILLSRYNCKNAGDNCERRDPLTPIDMNAVCEDCNAEDCITCSKFFYTPSDLIR